MAPPLVSVVVPTYNRFEWLPTAIVSVQAQTMADWELIVVDDGSTDGTERWVLELEEPRLLYIRRNHTGNIAAIRNAGVQAARGDWIAFLDSDDRWRPDKLARQFERLRRSPDMPWCYGAYQMVDRQGRAVPQPYGGPWRPFEGWIVDRILTTEAAVIVCTLLVQADLARQLRFDERMPLAEDYDFALRLAANTPGCAVDDVLAEIRIHEARTTTVSGRFDGHLGKAITYRKASRALPDPKLRRLARRQMRAHLRALARRAIRDGAVGEIVRALRSLRHL